jgi:hypothetical protein
MFLSYVQPALKRQNIYKKFIKRKAYKMITWNYNANDFKINETQNTLIPEGDHRVVVNRVTFKTYSSGNDGFEIMLDVSGHPGKLWHRIIMDPSNPEKTNHHLGKFFESFGITNYDLNCYDTWIGKDGAVRVKHDNYNGSISAKVLFCITRAYQTKLPAWGESSRTIEFEQSTSNTSRSFITQAMPNEHISSLEKKLPHREFNGFSF